MVWNWKEHNILQQSLNKLWYIHTMEFSKYKRMNYRYVHQCGWVSTELCHMDKKLPILYDSISITLLKFSTLLEIESRLVAAKG